MNQKSLLTGAISRYQIFIRAVVPILALQVLPMCHDGFHVFRQTCEPAVYLPNVNGLFPNGTPSLILASSGNKDNLTVRNTASA